MPARVTLSGDRAGPCRPGTHCAGSGRGHSRARVAPIGIQEHLPVVHHHHVPQSDEGSL